MWEDYLAEGSDGSKSGGSKMSNKTMSMSAMSMRMETEFACSHGIDLGLWKYYYFIVNEYAKRVGKAQSLFASSLWLVDAKTCDYVVMPYKYSAQETNRKIMFTEKVLNHVIGKFLQLN